ncbi:MAG: LysR substrate-binding domain-containing protein [Armatimonadota bacterium]
MQQPWTLEQLKSFLEVVRSGSFTKAAEALDLSQPAVSMQIRTLERNLGITLLERRPRKLLLTEAGEVVHRYAREMALMETGCRSEIGDLRKLERGRLRVGAGATPSIFTLAGLFAEYYRRWPDVELQVQIGRTQELVTNVLKDALDLAIISSDVSAEGLDIRPIYRERCVAIVGSHHPLYDRDTISVKDLSDYTLVMLPAESGFRRFLQDELRGKSIQLKVSMELASLEAIKEVVRTGVLASVVPETAVSSERPGSGLRALPMTGARLTRRTVAVRRSDKYVSEAMKAFDRLLSERWPKESLESGTGDIRQSGP